MNKTHPIYQVASFSRSGATLLLRCLNAHPEIHVVHQIKAENTKKQFALFRFLKSYGDTRISADHEIIRAASVPSGNAIIVKNAVWEHRAPYKGFVLVRNPFSTLRAFGLLKESNEGAKKKKSQFRRWVRDIDLQLCDGVETADNIACFCMLYNRRFYSLKKTGLPIVHYERFVSQPEACLRKIVEHLGLSWNDRCLRSHEDYQEGEYGHDRTKLWLPLKVEPAEVYEDMPAVVFSKVYGLTWPTFHAFGYQVEGQQVMLRENFEDRFAMVPVGV